MRELYPKRFEESNKGDYGKVLCIAGSKGMSGAAYLASRAAYSVGAGLVKIYTHEDNRIPLQVLIPEAIVEAYTDFNEKELLENIKWASVVIIGPGLSTSTIANEIIISTLKNIGNKPIVIDADGLNILAQEHLNSLKGLTKDNWVLTPHLMEASRLLNTDIDNIIPNKKQAVSLLEKEYNGTIVLKSHQTLVYQAGHQLYENNTGNSSMAKGGSGDVLSGVIGGLIAGGLSTFDGSKLGVFVHGKAGDFARSTLGEYSVLARDIICNIPNVMRERLDF
ncbi:MAG: NAD(P)H-hydrate dehydratase [Lachnospiraceae bacterium]|jgi:NAD(P)H-hydrate epimerase|nr:NAD(P)H-hydrate dehydratase [Lachnospiraceae bacterium]